MPSLIVYLQMAGNAFTTNTLKVRKPAPWVKKHCLILSVIWWWHGLGDMAAGCNGTESVSLSGIPAEDMGLVVKVI
jgi:hypothetical protein